MKKNPLAKSTQIRESKKFKTSINNFATAKKTTQIKPLNKMKTSINKANNNENSSRSNNPPSVSSKKRKSISTTTKKKTMNPTKNEEIKRKSIMKKPDSKSIRKNNDKKFKTTVNIKSSALSKKNSMTVSLKKDNADKGKRKTVKVQSTNLFNNKLSAQLKPKNKTAKKSTEIYDIDEEEKISSKDSQNIKDLKTSEVFNKNESVRINMLNNINDENENNNEDNNIILEKESEKNLTDNNPINNINDKSKKSSLKENNPIQNEFIKEKISNEFINSNSNFNNEKQECKLKNKFVQNSNYISEKNKNMMQNLLYLLDKKSDESKKNAFRSSLNSLDSKVKNKLLDITYKNRQKLYKMILEEDLNKLKSPYTPGTLKSVKPLTNIDTNDQLGKINDSPSKFVPFNYEDKYQNMKNKYLMMMTPSNPKKLYPSFYKDKYFVDYVEGKCPNRDLLERTMKYQNNIHNIDMGSITDAHKYKNYYNDRFHFMGKNDLSVEKRDNRYMFYNYGFMINTINDKLNGFITDKNFRQSFQGLHKTNSDFGLDKGYGDYNRNERASNLSDISPYEFRLRKTFTERNPFL